MKPEDKSLESGYEASPYNSSLETRPVTSVNLPPKSRRLNISLFKFNRLAALVTVSALLLMLLVGGGAYFYDRYNAKQTVANSEESTGSYKVGSNLSVSQASESQLLSLGQVNKLNVNGQLTVNNSLILTPTKAPSTPTAGEIYFNQANNQPYYYNGSQFVSLAPNTSPQTVTSLGGISGILGLGSGLIINGNVLNVSSSLLQSLSSSSVTTPVVDSLQGLTGHVSLVAGNGISLSSTTITNSGVTNLTSSNSSINITNSGNGSYDLTLAGGGGVILGPNAAQTDDSANPSLYINKTNPAGDLLDLESSGVASFVVNQSGQITVGTINYSQVQGTPAIVNSIGGSSGVIGLGSGLGLSGSNLTNTGVVSISGTANQVIASASTGSVTLSLPQSIATGSSPTFNDETLNGGLNVTGLSNLSGGTDTDELDVSGGTTLTGASVEDSTLNVQGGLTVGVPGSATGNIYLSNTSSTNTVDLLGENPSGSGTATVEFPTITAGTTDTVCLKSLANCGSSSAVTTSSSGTSGDLAMFTGANSIANSSISDNGSTVTVSEPLSANTITASTLQSGGALSISPGGTLTVGVSNHTLSLVGSSSSTFAASANGFTDTLGFTAPTTASHTVTLPDATGTVCLDNSLSCGFATSGSGVTSVDLLTGAIGINDTTGAGSTITIQSASTTQAGIAEFSSNDFQVLGGGDIDTIQGISSTSDVQFDSLALDNGGSCSVGGNLCLGNNGTVYASNYSNPSATNNLLISGGSKNIELENDSGVNSFVLPTSGGLGQTICTSGITCASGGGQAVILQPSSEQTDTGSNPGIYINDTQSGGNADLLQLQTSGSDALAIDDNGNATFSNTTTAATLDVTGTLQTNTITPTSALTIGSTSQAFTLQGTSSSLILGKNGTSLTYLGFATPSGNSATSGTIYYDLDNSAAANTSGSPYFICTTAGNCSGSAGSVTALGGSGEDYLSLFTSTLGTGGNIANSIVSESGSNTINIAGDLNVGASGLGQLAVGVANTVNGTIVVNNATNSNNITLEEATAPGSNVTIELPDTSGTVAVSATGPLQLNSTTGVLSCPTCDSSGGGGSTAVQSLNSLTGAVTLNNATTSSQNIQINYAKADGSTLGIAAFNATNFTDNGSGVINTVQNISTTSSPTFNNLTLQGTTGLTVGSTSNDGEISFLDGTSDTYSDKFSVATLTGNQTVTAPNASGTLAVSASGNLSLSALGNLTITASPTFSTSVTTPLLDGSGGLTITPNGSLTVGSTNQPVTLQGSASSTITATSGSDTTTISFNTPTANNAIIVPNSGGTICLSSNNCGYEVGGNFINNQTTQQTSANIDIQSAASAVAAKIQGASGQNILNLYSSANSSTPVADFDSAGDLIVSTNDINGATITGGTLSGSSLSATQLQFTGASGTINESGANSNLTVNATGTGTLALDTTGSGTLNLGSTNAVNINEGNSSSITDINGSGIQLQSGSSNLALTTSTSTGNITLTTNNASSAIKLEATTASTSAIQLGSSTVSDLTVDTSNNRVDVNGGSLSGNTATSQLYIAGEVPNEVGFGSSGLLEPNQVYVQGAYAYVANSAAADQLVIYNISNPASPTKIAQTNSGLGPTTIATSIFVQGNYAYITTGTHGNPAYLVIYNISDPTNPTYVTKTSTNLNNASDVYVQGSYAYVTEYNNSELVVFNISNPANPTYVGLSSTDLNEPNSVYVQGNYAYVASYNNSKLVAFNISNPANPTEVGFSSTDLNEPYSVYVQGAYAYVTDYHNNYLVVFNISDPTTPAEVGFSSTDLSEPYSVYVQGRYAYVASSNNGRLVTFDISTPSSPTEVGYATTDLSQPVNVFVSGRYGYVIDYSNNYLVDFDLGGAYAQQLQTGGAEVGTLSVDSDASIAGDLGIQGGLTVGTNAEVDNNLGVGGAVVFQDSTSGTQPTAFQVQNSSGTNLFQVDTSGNNIYLGGNNNSTEDIGAVGSAAFTSAINIGTSSGAAQTLAIGSSNSSSTLSLTAGNGITATSPNFNLNTSGVVSLGTVGTTSGQLTLDSSNAGGSVVLQSSTSQANSTTLSIPTDSHSTDQICLVTLANCSGSSGGSGDSSYIFNTTTQQTNANIDIQSTAGAVAAKIQGAVSQNILNLYSSASSTTAVDTFDSSGNLNADAASTFEDASNSATAFQVNNSTGTGLLQVDTNGNNVYLGDNSSSTGNNGTTVNIGAVGSESYNSNINVGTSSAGTQTIAIGSANTSTSLSLTAGNGITANSSITQAVSSGSSNGTISLLGQTATNANATSASTTVNADSIALQGTANSNSGANVLNGINFNNVTAELNNTFNGLYFGTGYTNFIDTPNFVLNSTGNITGAGTYDTATISGGTLSGGTQSGSTLSSTGLTFSGSTDTITGPSSSSITLDTTGLAALDLGNTNASTIALGNNSSATTLAGTFSETYSTSSATTVDSLSVTNNNSTTAGVTVQGIGLTPQNKQTPTSGSNILDVVDFLAGSGVGTGNTTNGINFASATGYTNFVNTPTFVLQSSGNITGAGTYDTATISGGTLSGGTVSGSTLSSTALTFSGASGTVTTNSGDNLTIDTGGGTSTLNLGNANATTLSIGNSNAATAVTIQGGTTSSAVAIQSGAAGTISIGTGNVANTLQIGSTSLSSGTQAINIGNNATSGGTTNITIGTSGSASGTATLQSTGTLALGNSVSPTINIQSTVGGAINIGTSSTSGSVTVGGSSETGTTVIKAEGIIETLTGSTAAPSSVIKTGTNSTTAFELQNSSAANLILADTQNGTVTLANTTQTAGTIGSWGTTTSVTPNTYGSVSVSYNGYMYFLGGSGSTAVYYDTISPNGSLGATWTTNTTSLPNPSNSLSNGFAYNGYMYYAREGSSQNIFYAPINSNGSLGSWTTGSGPTSTYTYTASVTEYNGYIYWIGGGSSNLQSTGNNATWYAPLNANGSIGSWSSGTALAACSGSVGCTYATAAAYNGYLYLIGGYNTGATAQTTVESIPISPTGSISGSWTSTNSLAQAEAASTTSIYNGYIYELDGENSGTNTYVQYASLNSNGTTSAWNTTTTGPASLDFVTSTAYNGYIYLLSGSQQSTYYAPLFNGTNDFASVNGNGIQLTGTTNSTTALQVQNATGINLIQADTSNGAVTISNGTDVGGTLGKTWTNSPNGLPAATSYANTVTYNGYIYELGGYISGASTATYYAPISANGSVGAWTSGATLQYATDQATAVVYNGYIYVLGGWNGTTYYNYVEYAPLSTNGSIGAWNTTIALPTGTTGPSTEATSVAYNGYLYILGGQNSSGNAIDNTYYAPINTNGTIGSWTGTTNIYSNTTLEYATSVVYNGNVYEIGGYNGTTVQTGVEYAPLSSSGIGAWTSTTALTSSREEATSVVYGNYIYELGGYSGGYQSTVSAAPIYSSGAVGTWIATASLPQTLSVATSAEYNGYIYELGGYNGAYQANVYYTNLYNGSQNTISDNGVGVIVANTVNSTNAFEVQNAAGGIALDVDTQNGRVGIGTTTPSAAFQVYNTSSSQGVAIFGGSVNSSNAFQIQTSALSNNVLFNADTTNTRIGIGQIAAPTSPVAASASGGSLGANLTYYFKITAVDAAGGQSIASAETAGSTTSGTCTASGNCEISLTWTASNGAASYDVYYATTAGTEANYFNVTGTSYTFSTTTGNTAGSPPASGYAYVNQLTGNSSGANYLTNTTIGTTPTTSEQLNVSGTIPTFVSDNSDSNLNHPTSVYVQGLYAYVVSQTNSKLMVYNLSSGTPVYVSQNSDSNLSAPQSVYVAGHYAYVTSGTTNKLVVYDISTGTPVFVGKNSDSNLSNPQYVYVQGNYAYVVSTGNSKLMVYNISSGTPVYVSQNSDSNLNAPENVYVQGSYAYVPSVGTNKLVVYNISSGTPVYVSQNSDSNLNEPYYVYVQGNYAYVASYFNNELEVYDISSGTPVFVGKNSDSNLDRPQAVYVQGIYAYVASTTGNKLDVYNISSGTPVYVGQNSDSNTSQVISLFVQGNYAYTISFGNSKIDIYNLGGEYTQQLQVGGISTGTLAVTSDASIAGDINVQGGLTIGSNTELDNNLSVAGSTLLQDTTNAVNAVQIQNTTGANAALFNVDTTNNRVGLGQIAQMGTVTPALASGGSLPATTTYYFKVSALDAAGGVGAASAETSGTTTSGTCTASGNCEINLTWTAITGAVSYNVYYGTSAGGEANYFNTATNSYTFATTTGNTAGSPSTTGYAYVNQLAGSSGGTNYLTSTTIRTPTNSSAAFQVQNAAGTSILTTSTTTNTITVNGNININQVSNPSSAPTTALASGPGITGTNYSYVYAYVTPSGISSYSATSSPALSPSNQKINVTVSASANAAVTGINIYRTTSAGPSGPFYLVNPSPLTNTNQTYTDNVADGSLGTAANDINLSAALQENGVPLVIADANNSTNKSYNTAVGYGSLLLNQTGQFNASLGEFALDSNTTGSSNSALGAQALQSNTTGALNSAVGLSALASNLGGNENAALGVAALDSNISGSYNTAVGYSAGNTDSSGHFATLAALQNATAIGSYAQVQASNTVSLGSVDTPTQVEVGTTIGYSNDIFGVSPYVYNTNSAQACSVVSTSSTTCLSSSSSVYIYDSATTAWPNAVPGDLVIFSDGQSATIASVDVTNNYITLNSALAEYTATYYRIQSIGLQVSNGSGTQGFVGVGTASPGAQLSVQTAATTTNSFSYTGSLQTYTVPSGVYSVTFTLNGGGGGNSSSGTGLSYGGQLNATVPVKPGDTLDVYVGGQGANGNSGPTTGGYGYGTGGSSPTGSTYGGGGGGGGSAIYDVTTSTLLAVAGGGGGTANGELGGNGAAGNSNGGNGQQVSGSAGGGGGTTSLAGGGGTCGGNNPGNSGSGTNGGAAGSAASFTGGGGGGGRFGGGGGCSGSTNFGGGGGGSGYLITNGIVVSAINGGNSGNGSVTITPNNSYNTFNATALVYNTGTASQSSGSTTITGSGTTWTSSMVGDEIKFADGQTETITGFTNSTQLTGSSTITSESSSAFSINYIGLQVSPSGDVGIGTIVPGASLQVNAPTSGTVAQIIQAASGQTADLLDIQNSSGNILDSISSTGFVYLNGSGSEQTTSSNTGIYLGTAGSPTPTPRIQFVDSGNSVWEIDNSSGALRFFEPANTALTLTTAGLNQSTLTIGGHILADTTKPMCTVVSGLGTGGTVGCTLTTGSSDTAGEVNIRTGSSGTSNPAVVDISFNFNFTNTPFVVFSAATDSAANPSSGVYFRNNATTNSGFELADTSALSINTTYSFNYVVVGY